MTLTPMHRLLMAGLALTAGANHKRGTWRRVDALTKANGATPTPKKPWQRPSDQQLKLRDLNRPAQVYGRKVATGGGLRGANRDLLQLASPKRDARRALEAQHLELTGQRLSPRQLKRMRKALNRAERAEAQSRTDVLTTGGEAA